MGHEEYANTKWNITLEEALRKGYVQSQYHQDTCLFDHAQKLMGADQVPAMAGFFFTQGVQIIPYAKMLIERPVNNTRRVSQGQNHLALEFTVTGEITQDAEADPTHGTAAGVNPLGDGTSDSFAKWIAEHKQVEPQ